MASLFSDATAAVAVNAVGEHRLKVRKEADAKATFDLG